MFVLKVRPVIHYDGFCTDFAFAQGRLARKITSPDGCLSLMLQQDPPLYFVVQFKDRCLMLQFFTLRWARDIATPVLQDSPATQFSSLRHQAFASYPHLLPLPSPSLYIGCRQVKLHVWVEEQST